MQYIRHTFFFAFLFVACKRSLDVGLIIDGSASVSAANFKKALDFLVDLVGHLAVSPQGTHVAVIVYDTQATLHFNLASSGYHTLSKLQSAIRGLSYLGKDTRTDVALEMAAEKIFSSSGGDRNDVDNLLIVLTGGKTSAASKPYEDVVLPLQVSWEVKRSIIVDSDKNVTADWSAEKAVVLVVWHLSRDVIGCVDFEE